MHYASRLHCRDERRLQKISAHEISEFKAEYRTRIPGHDAESLTDEDLLREAMNTVGKAGKLGEHVTCVVFGLSLLCGAHGAFPSEPCRPSEAGVLPFPYSARNSIDTASRLDKVKPAERDSQRKLTLPF
jgi:hypothetical protein